MPRLYCPPGPYRPSAPEEMIWNPLAFRNEAREPVGTGSVDVYGFGDWEIVPVGKINVEKGKTIGVLLSSTSGKFTSLGS